MQLQCLTRVISHHFLRCGDVVLGISIGLVQLEKPQQHHYHGNVTACSLVKTLETHNIQTYQCLSLIYLLENE